MHKLDFLHPVKVCLAKEYPVETIEDLHALRIFLEKWPVERRGPVYQCAMNSCNGAESGHVPLKDAVRSFVSFARITNILVDDGERTIINTDKLHSLNSPHTY